MEHSFHLDIAVRASPALRRPSSFSLPSASRIAGSAAFALGPMSWPFGVSSFFQPFGVKPFAVSSFFRPRELFGTAPRQCQ
jgi:hypothetical protein